MGPNAARLATPEPDEEQATTEDRGAAQRPRLLVVSRDASFVDALRAQVSELDVLTLTEATTRHALLVGSPILDDIGLAVLDGTVSGEVRLRLYDRLRPSGSSEGSAVVFTRSGFAAGRSKGPQGTDLYLPAEATVREIAWWCGALLALPRRHPGRRFVAGPHHLPAPRAMDVPSESSPAGYGWVAQAGLWGVAAALAALTFWPSAERSAIGDSIRGQVRSLFGVQSVFADAPALPDPAAQPTR